MSFAADDLRYALDALIAPKPLKDCQVCALIGDGSPLEPDLRGKLRSAVDGGVGAEKLSKVMRHHGHVLPKQSVYDHRNEKHNERPET